MAMAATSLESIHAWARQCFPDDFNHLPNADSFVTPVNIIAGYNNDMYFKSLYIGTIRNKRGRITQLLA
jgi:hypothetical protein